MSEINLAKFKRDPETGLLIGYPYVYFEDGSINWRAMVKPEFLVVNKQYQKVLEEKLKKPLAEISVTEVEDRYLLVLLNGLKFLAKVRGYSKLLPSPVSYASPTCCAVTTNITWIPNIESEMREITIGGVGGASTNNTGPIGKNKVGEWAYYLEATAENRALVRAIRLALSIQVLGADEIGSSDSTPAYETTSEPITRSHEPHIVLESKIKAMGVDSFAKFKKAYLAKYADTIKQSNPEEWTDYSSIPPLDIWTILGVLDKAQKEAEAKKAAK